MLSENGLSFREIPSFVNIGHYILVVIDRQKRTIKDYLKHIHLNITKRHLPPVLVKQGKTVDMFKERTSRI